MFAALCRVANGNDGALMGFEQEAVSELYASVWGDRFDNAEGIHSWSPW